MPQDYNALMADAQAAYLAGGGTQANIDAYVSSHPNQDYNSLLNDAGQWYSQQPNYVPGQINQYAATHPQAPSAPGGLANVNGPGGPTPASPTSPAPTPTPAQPTNPLAGNTGPQLGLGTGPYPQSWIDTYNAQTPETQQAIQQRYGGMSQQQIEQDWNQNVQPQYGRATPQQILSGQVISSSVPDYGVTDALGLGGTPPGGAGFVPGQGLNWQGATPAQLYSQFQALPPGVQQSYINYYQTQLNPQQQQAWQQAFGQIQPGGAASTNPQAPSGGTTVPAPTPAGYTPTMGGSPTGLAPGGGGTTVPAPTPAGYDPTMGGSPPTGLAPGGGGTTVPAPTPAGYDPTMGGSPPPPGPAPQTPPTPTPAQGAPPPSPGIYSGAYPQSWIDTYNSQSPAMQAQMYARYYGQSPEQIMGDWNTNIASQYAPGTTTAQILGGAAPAGVAGAAGAAPPGAPAFGASLPGLPNQSNSPVGGPGTVAGAFANQGDYYNQMLNDPGRLAAGAADRAALVAGGYDPWGMDAGGYGPGWTWDNANSTAPGPAPEYTPAGQARLNAPLTGGGQTFSGLQNLLDFLRVSTPESQALKGQLEQRDKQGGTLEAGEQTLFDQVAPYLTANSVTPPPAGTTPFTNWNPTSLLNLLITSGLFHV